MPLLALRFVGRNVTILCCSKRFSSTFMAVLMTGADDARHESRWSLIVEASVERLFGGEFFLGVCGFLFD